MRDYELTVILKSDLEDEEREQAIGRVNTWLVGAGAEADAIAVNHWGQKTLAYPINNVNLGYYVFFEASMDPDKTREIERNISFRDEIMRHLLIRKE